MTWQPKEAHPSHEMTNWGAAAYYCAKCGEPDPVGLERECAGPDRCGVCVFWDAERRKDGAVADMGRGTSATVSACKRRSPVRGHGAAAEWPQTDRADLCGDFKRRDRRALLLSALT